LQKGISTSSLLIGIIEEVEIHRIKFPKLLFYGVDRTETPELVDSMKEWFIASIIGRTRGNFFESYYGCRRYNACESLGVKDYLS
jgi:hypothetical protein